MIENQVQGLRNALMRLVTQTIEETTGRHVSVGEEDPLIQGGFLDSLSMVNLVLALQVTYGIVIDLMEIDENNFGSIANLAALVERRTLSSTQEDML